MVYFMALAFAIGIGVPIAAFGASLGQGRAAGSALESMARQPEMANKIQTMLILSLAFIESLVLFSFVVFILLKSSLPTTDQALQAIKDSSAASVTTH